MPPRPSRAKKKPVDESVVPVEDPGSTGEEEVIAAALAAEGAASSEGERPADVGEDAGSIPARPIEVPVEDPLTTAEVEILHEAVSVGVETDEPPIDPEDWPEEPPVDPESPLVAHMSTNEILTEAALRSLRSDVRPIVGAHYVIFGGKPVPVKREFAQTEDEYVRSQLNVSDELRDHDGNRVARADRTLRMRYRGYVCGEMNTL